MSNPVPERCYRVGYARVQRGGPIVCKACGAPWNEPHKNPTVMWRVGDVVSLGSERLYDVTQVNEIDDGWLRVWPQSVGDLETVSGRWVSVSDPKITRVESPSVD